MIDPVYYNCMKQAILQKLSNATLRQRTAARIREAILNGSLHAGEKLVERELASQLGCSQATVREALIQLEAEGFITKTPNSATYVTHFSRAGTAKSFALRQILEGYAMEEAGRLATPEQIQALERRYLEMVEAALKGEQALFIERERAWHEAIWDMTDNQYLIAALRRLVLPQLAFSAVRIHSGRAPDLIADARSHLPMLEAIKSKNPEQCRKALDDIIEGWQAVWVDLGWVNGNPGK
jgi:DNA-binding GntR family transcriptional regulator